MRLAAVFASLLLLSACSSVTTLREAWYWEPANAMAPVRAMPAGAAAPHQVAGLQAERAALRSRVAVEPDIWQRQMLYARLHEIGMRLAPVERQVGAAAPLR